MIGLSGNDDSQKSKPPSTISITQARDDNTSLLTSLFFYAFALFFYKIQHFFIVMRMNLHMW